MHGGRCAGQIGVGVAEPGRERGRETGIQTIVVEDSDERLIKGERTNDERYARRACRALYFSRDRQPFELLGTNRLYRTM